MIPLTHEENDSYENQKSLSYMQKFLIVVVKICI